MTARQSARSSGQPSYLIEVIAPTRAVHVGHVLLLRRAPWAAPHLAPYLVEVIGGTGITQFPAETFEHAATLAAGHALRLAA